MSCLKSFYMQQCNFFFLQTNSDSLENNKAYIDVEHPFWCSDDLDVARGAESDHLLHASFCLILYVFRPKMPGFPMKHC